MSAYIRETDAWTKRLPQAVLHFSALIYSTLVQLRLALYRRGWLKSAHPGIPVISVGNITVGGAGKTPLVDYLTARVCKQGWYPAILSRGYKNSSAVKLQRIRFCDSSLSPDELGDEPWLLASRHPSVPVYVGPDRVAAAKRARKRDNPDLFILDDGFQHLAIARDLNLLLIDAEHGLGSRKMLPWGELREPEEECVRADAIIITKANLGFADEVFRLLKEELRVRCPVFRFSYQPYRLKRLDGKIVYDPVKLKGRRVLLTCGIARPQSFRRVLEQLGGEIAGELSFADHHRYAAASLRKMFRLHEKTGYDYWVTTEKDWTKLKAFPELAADLWVLEMTVVPDPEWEEFFQDFLHQQRKPIHTGGRNS